MAALVQDATGAGTSGGGSVSVSFASLPSAGDFIAVILQDFGPVTVTSVVNNQGNPAYSLAVDKLNSPEHAAIYYVPNIGTPSGTFTVTVNYTGSGTNTVRVTIADFSGVVTSAPVDITASNSGNSTAPTVSGTTLNANDLLIAAQTYLFVTGDPGGSWVVFASSQHEDYQLVSATGTYTATWSGSLAGTWATAFAAFKTVPFTPKFRKTLSPIGSHVGGRQRQAA